MNQAEVIAEALKIILTSKTVDGDLPGGKWCDECGIVTNHIGAMHREDEREPDDVKPDEEPLDDPEYRDDGGEC